MSQRTSPWRVNDAVFYDALRDEYRSSLAATLATGNAPGGIDVAGVIQQLRVEMYGVDGFDRTDVDGMLSQAVQAPQERPRG